ncbi:hypothetical protein P3X46_033062 [Hevea brasiliensis]|uniref:RNase H type-1 domain-containing protein n=2 Tax=Hevea brasiliensis TaxID=3981 RepID=A0ABQ9KF99_HEVBR|nr:hypothetical protein P3X46_033062 [Hevea brasiliensis]
MIDCWSEIATALSQFQANRDYLPLVAFLFWRLWKSRNMLTFENKQMQFQEVVAIAIHSLEEFQQAHKASQSLPTQSPRPLSNWSPPAPGCFKINFDVALAKHRNEGSIVAIIRDSSGQPLGWYCKKVSNLLSSLVLEALACKLAVQLAIDKVINDVIVEGDALVVIQGVQSQEPMLEIQGIIQDVAILTQSIQRISFTHASRVCKKAAHSLAQKSLHDLSFLYNPMMQVMFVRSLMPL